MNMSPQLPSGVVLGRPSLLASTTALTTPPFVLGITYGVVGDGATDDTQAIINTIAAAVAVGAEAFIIGSAGTNHVISFPIPLTAPSHWIRGAGMGVSNFIVTGNFTAAFTVAATVTQMHLSDFTVTQTGTTTQCLNIAIRTAATYALDLERVGFSGNMASTSGALVYCGGVLVQFLRCFWIVGGSSYTGCVCLQLDSNNENTSLIGCVMIGYGNGINMTKNGSYIGCQGVRIQDCVIVGSGVAYNIHVGGQAANTYITNTVCDQAGTNAILIDTGAAAVTISGGWAGLQSGSTGESIAFDPTTAEILIQGMQIFGGDYNILGEANVSQRMGGLQILNNQFAGAATATMQLDSINGATITGNRDYNSGIPSLVTAATNSSGGQYIIGANAFTTTAPTLNSSSSYKSAGTCTGWSLETDGANSAASGTTVTVTHNLNCGLTPDCIQITARGSNPGDAWVSSQSSTQFVITYATSGAAAFYWSAKIAR